MHEIKTAEMFAGCGGFRKGIEQAIGIRPITARTVWANDNQRHASAVYRYHYREVTEGDIREINTGTIPDFDILTAGFPCQSFSNAGRRKGFDDTRGTLFFEVARILANKRPQYFLLENVKGLVGNDSGKTFQRILEVLTNLGYRDLQWCVLNSTSWIPQNRERVFIIGHLGERSRPEIFPLPKNGGILNPDGSEIILPSLTTTDYKGPSKQRAGLIVPDIAPAITQNNVRTPSLRNQGGVIPLSGLIHTGRGMELRQSDDSHCLKGAGGGSSKNFITLTEQDTSGVIPVLTPDRMNQRQNGRRFKESGEDMFTLTGQDIHGVMVVQKIRGDQIGVNEEETGTLVSHRSGGADKIPIVSVPVITAGHKSHEFRLHETGGEIPTLKERMGTGGNDASMGARRFRRLTPTECEILQGLPPGWTAMGLYLTSSLPKKHRGDSEWMEYPVSDTQRYRLTGNAVTTLVIEAVFGELIDKWF